MVHVCFVELESFIDLLQNFLSPVMPYISGFVDFPVCSGFESIVTDIGVLGLRCRRMTYNFFDLGCALMALATAIELALRLFPFSRINTTACR